MSPLERAQEAHRASFALVTAAIIDPDHVDLNTVLDAYLADSTNPVHTLTDITAALAWHTASALMLNANHNTDAALQTIRDAAHARELNL